MKTLNEDRWERYSELVEQLQGLAPAQRDQLLASLRDRGEDADILDLVALHFRLPAEPESRPQPAWVAGGEPAAGYRLVRELGSGAFGTVWEAVHNNVAVAVKQVRLRGGLGQKERASIELVLQFRHPHLLRVAGYWVEGDDLLIEMDLADTNLRQLARRSPDGTLPPGDLLGYVQDAAEGLDFLAQGNPDLAVLHRDIKPENLLVLGKSVVVGDFGLAKAVTAAHGSHSRFAMTLPYAAPEWFRGETSPQSDQYSLALTYVELRTGRHVFEAHQHSQESLVRAHLDLPPDLSSLPADEAAVAARALSKDPSRRWPDCRSFARALRAAAAGSPSRAAGEAAPLHDNAVARTVAAEEDAAPEALRSCLQPDGAIIADRSRGFLGREHVFEQLDAFLAREPSGYFVLQGSPGMGKSAVLAHLVVTRNYVRHFNRAGEVDTPGKFLRNVCARLILRHRLPHASLPEDAERDPRFFNGLLESISARLPAGQRLVLAVDALDEVDRASCVPGRPLHLPACLPQRVFAVVTTRPLDALDPRRLRADRSHLLVLEEAAEWNRRDVRRYIEAQFGQEEGIRGWAGARQLAPAAFVELLLEKSEGNFMYLRHVLPALARPPEPGRYVSAAIGAQDLPQGLTDYYRKHWAQMHAGDPEAFDRLYRPVICCLAAAEIPVSARLVAKWKSLPAHHVERVLGLWREFLLEERAEGQRVYRIYHTSFKEFLRDEIGLVDEDTQIMESGLQMFGVTLPPRST